ncbi:truncated IS1605 transposase [Mycobacterium tuberculosis]|nr:truncated IS1605 transposase [Mycobacterium tuberculosis]
MGQHVESGTDQVLSAQLGARGTDGKALGVGGRIIGWAPSSKTCHACRHVQDIGWGEKWQCDGCSITHQRDDNAAINLARYEDTSSVVGPVGAAVKRGADRKTGPGPAGGREARKGTGHPAGEQPRDGVLVA